MHELFIAILSVLVGCVAPSTTAPSASAPSTGRVNESEHRLLRMADAVPLAQVRTNDTDIDLSSRINTPKRSLLFGQLDTSDSDGDVVATEPVIAYKDAAGNTQVLKVADERLKDGTWMFIASGPKHGEIWGVLDAGLDAMQVNILLAHSIDNGETFSLVPIPKPDRRADYDSFCLDKSGYGRLSVFLAGDEKRHLKQGYYNYLTTDGGATWSSPQREPDALKKADDISDDEQDDSDSPPTRRA
jgi:hypothetical protein